MAHCMPDFRTGQLAEPGGFVKECQQWTIWTMKAEEVSRRDSRTGFRHALFININMSLCS